MERHKEGDRATLSSRRIVAIVVAIGSHVALLCLILRPASHSFDVVRADESQAAMLQLRLMASPPPAKAAPPEAPRRVAHAGVKPPARSRLAEPAEAPRSRPRPPDAVPSSTPPPAPLTYPGNRELSGDGGFRERLLGAQRGQPIHGVPGSDRRIAPGLQMVNPMNQGVGSVMRAAQGLFGITNKHCIDVEVWNSLTDQERAAKPVSPSEMKKEAETYHCNRPLGLTL